MKKGTLKRIFAFSLAGTLILGVPMYQAEAADTPGESGISDAEWSADSITIGDETYEKVPYGELSAVADDQQDNQWDEYAVDGNVETFWHTHYGPNNVIEVDENETYLNDNTITITLANPTDLAGITYLPRQGSGITWQYANGYIETCNVYVSTDGTSFSDVPAATTDWVYAEENFQQERTLVFGEAAEDVKAVKLEVNTAHKSATGIHAICGSEFSLLKYREAEADYTAVDAAIAEAGALTEDQYTEDSWAVLQAAVEAVQRGLGVSDQEIVNGYAEAIQNAIDGLVRVYIVTVNGEEFMRGVYNTPVTVTAPEAPEGQKFAGWSVNGNIISLDETYLFYLGGDVELTATYVDAEQDVEQSPSAIMSNIIITDAGSGRYNVKLVGQVVVPDGYTLQQAGVLIGRNTELAQLHSDNGGVADGVTKAMSSVVNTKGQFSMNVKNMPAGNSMQCEIYLSVQNNATGETEWFYSPVQLVEV